MSKKIISFNAPKQLLPLAQKWANEGKSFYLGPDNIFIHNDSKVVYAGAENVSKIEGSWYICTEDNRVITRYLYKSEVEEIQNAFAASVDPEIVSLFIDNKCNSRCYMCPYHGEDTKYYNDNLKSAQVTVTLEEVKKRIDKIAEAGIKNISIVTNGEILVYKDWEKVYRYAASKGMGQFFNTNGFMLTEQVIKKLVDIGNIHVEVSLHALDFDTWSAVTRTKNRKLYETAINAPLLLKKYGINTSVAYVKTDRNIHVLKEFIDYWVPKVDQVTLVNQINIDHDNNQYEANYSEPVGICMHARGQLYILPNGKVAPCSWIITRMIDDNRYNLPDWNIKTHSIEEINAEIKEAWKTGVFSDICAKCPRNSRRDVHFDTQIYNYKAYKTGAHIRIPASLQTFKNKTSFKYRLERFIKRVKRFI